MVADTPIRRLTDYLSSVPKSLSSPLRRLGCDLALAMLALPGACQGSSVAGTIVLPAGTTNLKYSGPLPVLSNTIFDATAWKSTAVGHPPTGTAGVAVEIGPRDTAPGVNHGIGAKNATWKGGIVQGSIPTTESWRTVHDGPLGGAGVTIHNNTFAEWQFLRVHNVEDGMKPREAPEWSNGGSWLLRDSYFTAIRDDCIENDRFEPGTVQDCLFDGVHTFMSEQKESGFLHGGGIPVSIGSGEDDTIHVKRVYVRIFPTNAFDPNQDKFAGGGKWFKWAGDPDGQPAPTAPNHKVLVEDSVFAVGAEPRSGWGNLSIPSKVTWVGSNNYILWLGPPGTYGGPQPAGVTFLEGSAAQAKWQTVRNQWLTSHGLPSQGSLAADYNPHTLTTFTQIPATPAQPQRGAIPPGKTMGAASGSMTLQASLVLVEKGRPRSAIVLPPLLTKYGKMAAEELQDHLRRASGVEIPIIKFDARETLSPETVRILIGSGSFLQPLGVDTRQFQPEEYLIRAAGNQLIFAAGEEKNGPRQRRGRNAVSASEKPETSIAVVWAVDRFLDTQLGIRWLWPGESGTYVPTRETIDIAPLEIKSRPTLECRKLRQYQGPDIERWSIHHMLGERTNYQFGHQFGDWWEKYGAQHPEYFAMDPEGKRGTFEPANRMKQCISNPAVGELILAQWRDAGRPDVWTVCPTDSGGFCTCPNCRAMDSPDQLKIKPEDIWRERGVNGVNMTHRYLTFWNGLIQRMRAENPRIALCSYVYSVYRQPPVDLKVEKGMVLAFVPKSYDAQFWDGWRAAGAQVLFLRPNWWHIGPPAPYLPIHAQGNYFRHAQEKGMIGFDFDTLMGFWGTQGPLYYLVARLGSRPDLSVENVIGEYCSAFGEAAPAIREYLDYWEKYSGKAAYEPSHNEASAFPAEGLYLDACVKHKLNPEKPPEVSWRILSDLYPDPVINAADAILERAKSLARTPPEDKRVDFLKDGLRFLRVCRDFMENPDDIDRFVKNLEGIDPLVYDMQTLKNLMLVKPRLIRKPRQGTG